MKIWSFFEEYQELTSPDGTFRLSGGNLLIKLPSKQRAVIVVSDLSLAGKIAKIWNLNIQPSDFILSIKKDKIISSCQSNCLVFLFKTIEEFERYSSNPSDSEILSDFLYRASWQNETMQLTKC